VPPPLYRKELKKIKSKKEEVEKKLQGSKEKPDMQQHKLNQDRKNYVKVCSPCFCSNLLSTMVTFIALKNKNVPGLMFERKFYIL